MSFETTAYTLSLFLVGIGLFLFWIAYKEGGDSKSIINPRVAFILLGMFYIGLAHFSTLTGLAYSITLTNQAPCENVVNTSTYNGSTSVYTWYDSCYNRATPRSMENLYATYTGLLYFNMFALFMGLSLVGAKMLMRKW